MVIYIYAGYPLLIALLARWSPRLVRKAVVSLRYSILISCYHETERLVEKVAQVLALAGKDQLIEVLVGIDGPVDGIDALADRMQNEKVRIFPLPGVGANRPCSMI